MKDILKTAISENADTVNIALGKICDKYEASSIFTKEMAAVTESVRYSLTACGKRIRPFLARCFCNLCGGNENKAIQLGCALEMVHTYSLIHDDLPCMDDDDMRRGKPTNHKVFGEATAVLAGDGLLTEAFAVITECDISDKAKVEAVKVLAQKAGLLGMIGGQEIDLSSEGKDISLETLRILQKKKTGMLIEAGCLLGCIAAECTDEKTFECASEFAHAFGLAFQITDDILDVTGTQEELGKNIGSDEKEHKCTFVTHLGLDGARKEAERQLRLAKASLKSVFSGEYVDLLCELCDYLLERRS